MEKNSWPLMNCGHVALALDKNNNWLCPLCIEVKQGAIQVNLTPPDLGSRQAICHECGKFRDSDLSLPFFSYRPGNKFDSFYNGCHGWG